jgi:PAS domain S-box-containing protein
MIEPSSVGEKGIILVVDDNAALLLMMTKMLVDNGYEVLSAKNGPDALALAQQHTPHLILLDVIMPGMSGYDVCTRLKSEPATRDIPVVFVSGLTETAEKISGLKLGALDYITKPVDKAILLTKADVFVNLCRNHRQNMAMHDEQKRLNLELQQFSKAIDCASDGVVFTDTEGRITFVNMAFGYLSQRVFSEVAGQVLDILFSGNPMTQSSFLKVFDGEPVTIEENLLRKDGAVVPVQLRCSAIMDELLQLNGLLLLISDLSERKRDEQVREQLKMEMLHAKKLESVGQLAAGIAHEINTPIQFVGDNLRFMKDSVQQLLELQMLQKKLLEAAKECDVDAALIQSIEKAAEAADLEYVQAELPAAIEQSLDGVKRVASIVMAMKEFAHPGTAEMAPANLNDAILTTVTVARNKWKYVAVLNTDLDASLPLVPCLLGEFNQVILNLIVNAADAIHDVVGETGGQGEIKITTRSVGDYAEVRISDTGGGIPAVIRERIFDPFFTTKEVGSGSGQGLAIARSVVVSKHYGKFYFETKEGYGTTFIIRLPFRQPAASVKGGIA